MTEWQKYMQIKFPLFSDFEVGGVRDSTRNTTWITWKFRGNDYGLEENMDNYESDQIAIVSLTKRMKEAYKRMTRGIYASQVHGARL